MITTSTPTGFLPAKKSPVKGSAGVVTSHDQPIGNKAAADAGKPTQVITTSDFDSKGQLTNAAKKRLGRDGNA